MIGRAMQTYEGSSLAPKPEMLSREALIALVQQVQGRNEDAFDTLYNIYYPHVYGLLISMVGSPDAGKDLAQETFLRVWSKLPLLRERQRFPTWLFTIAKNVSRDYLRKTKRELPWSDIEEPRAFGDITVGVEDRELFRMVLAQVSPKAREVLRLYSEDYSRAEIAAR